MTGGMGGGSNSTITKWIEANCKEVSSDKWQSTSANNNSSKSFMNRGPEMGGKLYEYVGE
ncbi:MAG: hypothetical protein ACXVP5_10160, partial [Tumebacillaceae bacterium]